MLKDAEELALMREASRKNDETLRRTIEGLREGMTEREVAAMYNAIGKELGASGPSFDTLICFGPQLRRAAPQLGPTPCSGAATRSSATWGLRGTAIAAT